jgi:hypothetical protein
MAHFDPADRALQRLAARRFAARCEAHEYTITRADTLREVSRLATIAVPANLYDSNEARDAQRHVLLMAEERARDIIKQQIDNCLRADPDHRTKLRSQMDEDWRNLTGTLGHLRTWAQRQLAIAEQQEDLSGG